MLEYRFRTRPPERIPQRSFQTDARLAADVFPALAGNVTDVITSPPYLDTTNYREDQWLRLWFLGGEPLVPRGRGDDRHYSKDIYWKFIQASMKGLGPLLAELGEDGHSHRWASAAEIGVERRAAADR